MVLNLFKNLASTKSEAAHRSSSSSSRNQDSATRYGATSRSTRMQATSAPTPQHPCLADVLAGASAIRPAGSSRLPPSPSGSLSAPASPSSLKSSIPLKMKQPTSGIRPPVANIIVEKGRIEFVKTDPSTASVVTTTTPSKIPPPPPPTLEKSHHHHKLVMGTKIFRPLSQRKTPSECHPSTSVDAKLPTTTEPATSVRQRSASPKLSKEAAATAIESRIPSVARIVSAKPPPPDVVSGRPRPVPSRETSPAPSAAGNKSSPAVKSSSGGSIPVSPNLIRWRAKLSTSSSPAVTSHLNQVAGAASMAKKSTTPKTSAPQSVKVAAVKSWSGAQPVQVDGSTPADVPAASSHNNQMQLLNLHYEVKRLEETVQTLLPLRHQQSALIQSYEERLNEAQSRLASAEAEVAQLKERLARAEGAEIDGRQTIQQLEADKASVAASHEQQRIVFDKCLDEIANHVVQALISQKNLQGECRRLRSQVSDLEQRNVALNLLLTQSLRDSMLDNKKAESSVIVKSHSYDAANGAASANPRDSLCSTVSDSEIRLNSSASIFETGVRPLVSKDSNWTLSSSSSSSSASQATLAVQQSAEHNPVERAEKLLAVLKHRLFSAQLNSYKSIKQPQTAKSHEHRRSLVLPAQSHAFDTSPLPARPSTLAFCQTTSDAPTTAKSNANKANQESTANDPSTPSVRALVQVLEKRVGCHPSPSGTDKLPSPPRPPLPLAPGLMRAIRNAGVVTGEGGNDSPASKDEGYSTMSSDVQVDSSSSSSSSFIASGCSSPATLRRSAGSTPPNSTTRSLPMAKRKTLLGTSTTTGLASESSRLQPNRSISLQETHSGAGLEELKEEASDETNEDTVTTNNKSSLDRLVAPPSCRTTDYPLSTSSSFKREWPGAVQLGTLCEDWSPSSAASDSEPADDEQESDDGEMDDEIRDQLFSPLAPEPNMPKWTSDSQLYRADHEEVESSELEGGGGCKTLQLNKRGGGVGRWKCQAEQRADESEEHPLRRSRAQVQLAKEDSPLGSGTTTRRLTPNYSQHEMEDWILDGEHDPSPSESEELTGANTSALAAISEISYDDDDDDDEEEDEEEEVELFTPVSPECDGDDDVADEEEETDEEDESLDTEFTRDYYRLVKFESNRSLANSEKYDHCAPDECHPAAPLANPPPDRQVALQSVLDFIAQQQRYCAIRETADKDLSQPITHDLSLSSAGHRPDRESSVSSLLQLRHLMADDDEDSSSREADRSDNDQDDDGDVVDAPLHDGFATNWINVRQTLQDELNNPDVRASVLEKLLRSSSSTSCQSSSNDSCQDDDEEDRTADDVSHC